MPVTDLINELRTGHASAWARVSGIVETALGRFSRAFGVEERDEVACDALSEIWRALEVVKDEQRFEAFVRSVTRRLAWRRARILIERRKRLESPVGKEAQVLPEAQRRVEYDELCGVLASRLKDSHDRLFRLLYVAEVDAAELRSQLGLSATQLRKQKHLLHKQLRDVATRYLSGARSLEWDR